MMNYYHSPSRPSLPSPALFSSLLFPSQTKTPISIIAIPLLLLPLLLLLLLHLQEPQTQDFPKFPASFRCRLSAQDGLSFADAAARFILCRRRQSLISPASLSSTCFLSFFVLFFIPFNPRHFFHYSHFYLLTPLLPFLYSFPLFPARCLLLFSSSFWYFLL